MRTSDQAAGAAMIAMHCKVERSIQEQKKQQSSSMVLTCYIATQLKQQVLRLYLMWRCAFINVVGFQICQLKLGIGIQQGDQHSHIEIASILSATCGRDCSRWPKVAMKLDMQTLLREMQRYGRCAVVRWRQHIHPCANQDGAVHDANKGSHPFMQQQAMPEVKQKYKKHELISNNTWISSYQGQQRSQREWHARMFYSIGWTSYCMFILLIVDI